MHIVAEEPNVTVLVAKGRDAHEGSICMLLVADPDTADWSASATCGDPDIVMESGIPLRISSPLGHHEFYVLRDDLRDARFSDVPLVSKGAEVALFTVEAPAAWTDRPASTTVRDAEIRVLPKVEED